MFCRQTVGERRGARAARLVEREAKPDLHRSGTSAADDDLASRRAAGRRGRRLPRPDGQNGVGRHQFAAGAYVRPT